MGEKITDYTQLVSGQQYYIGATVSSTDYYFSAASENVGTGIKGTAVTDKTEATKVTAIGSGASWAFQLSSGNYLSLKNAKDNGKVAVVDTEAKWTLSNKSSLVNMTINKYCLQRNSSATTTNFGSYQSGQKDVWFELVPAEKSFTVTLQDNGVKYSELTESKVGAGVELPTLSSPCTDWSFVGWAETAIAETTTRPTIIEAGTYKPTKDITLYAVYSKTVENGSGATDVVFDVATIASENKWANGTAYLSYTIAPITITYSGGGNNGKYYSSDESWRIYSGGSIKITSPTSTITKVTTYPSNNFTKQTDGSWVFNATKTVQFKEFTVSYSGGSTTTYASSPVCGSAQQATITFDLNGGTGTTPASITDEEGKKITLPAADGITKDGYIFVGWNTTVDGKGTDYAAEAEYIIPTSGATLYAKWQQVQQEAEPPYTIMLIANPTNSGVVAFDESGEDTKEFSAAGATATITATPNAHFRFAKWTVFDGDAEIADPSAAKTTIMVKKVKETMLAANFVPLYSITTSSVTNGILTLTNTTKADDITEAAENDVLEIALSISEGYVLKSLTVNGKAPTATATAGKYTFTMPAAAVSIEATIEQTKTWYLVYDMTTLNAGDQVVFAYADKSHVAGALSTKDYLTAVTATFGADKTTITSLPDNANVFTLGGTDGAYTFANANGNLMSNKSGTMAFGTTANTWDVQIEDGKAKIINVANSKLYLQYNVSAPRFNTYSGNQSDIQIFTDHKLIQKATAHWYVDAAHSKELTEAYAKQSTGFVAYFVTNSDGAKTFSSSNSAVATIDADGVITIVGEGTTTISCTTESTSDYLTNSASFVLNVLPENACIWFATDINSTSNTTVGIVLEDPVKLEFAKNSSTNAPTFRADDGTVRFYGSNTLTISGENRLITDIKIVFATGYVGFNWTASTGTYAVSGVEGTWKGLASEVILTNSTKRSDIISIEVHYLNSEVVRRGLTAGRYGTICLEKNVTAMLGASFYEIAYREDKDGTPYKVCFDEVSALEAGVPYIFLAEDEQITVVYGDETATVAGSKNGLVGTFEDISDGDAGAAGNQLEGNYLVNNNMIRLCGGNCNLPAHRAYIRMNDVSTTVVAPAPGRRRITLQNADTQVASGLNGISEDSPIAPQQQGIYDVLGRKLEQTAGTGFYIIDGKKQVVVK